MFLRRRPCSIPQSFSATSSRRSLLSIRRVSSSSGKRYVSAVPASPTLATAAVGILAGMALGHYIHRHEKETHHQGEEPLPVATTPTLAKNVPLEAPQQEQPVPPLPPPAVEGEHVLVGSRGLKLPAAFLQEMSDVFGDRFSVAEARREEFSKDPSFHTSYLPDAVVFPTSTEDVQNVAKLCSKYKVRIIPYGHGTSLEGHTSADLGGLTVSMENMNNVIAIHPEDMDAVVQPGITYEELNDILRPYNLFFSVDPGPGAALGGMVGTGSSGTNAVRYGTMRENVLSLKVVTMDGNVIKTGQRARKSSAGYDLTHLFIGSEGTLGITTELTVRLRNIPEASGVALCSFDKITDAANVVIEALQRGINIGKVELLDDLMMKAVNMNITEPREEKATLFFEFAGSAGQVKEQERIMRELATKHNGGEFHYAEGAESEELWSARKNALWYSFALRPGADMMITDVCVPISQLATCIEETKKDLSASPLLAPMVGHVGDGNFHLFILLQSTDPKEVEEANRLNRELVQRAIRLEGTCTGEHGVGLGKKKFLPLELGDEAVDVMRKIKKALDPDGLLNPGKIFDIEKQNNKDLK